MYSATAENSAKAREILERKIEAGRTSAQHLLERIEQDVPDDAIVRADKLDFRSNGGISIGFGGQELRPTDHALGQLAEKGGIPAPYLRALAHGEEQWQRDLGAEILQQSYREGQAGSRYLARSVRGELRGFMSDKYRRLDSRPLVEAFALECQKVGAVPVDGTVSETRVALKALVPQVYEPVPGEVLAFGVEWGNSDYGSGRHTLRAFMLRVWCLNGATLENALAQVHLGGRLSDDITLSQRTYELDTRASVSALRDVVRGTLAPPKINQYISAIQSAQSKEIDWKTVQRGVGAKLLKSELEAARTAFESQDVYNLPKGNTAWRASNALSWIANGKDVAPDRKLALERLAGEVVSGKRDVAEVE